MCRVQGLTRVLVIGCKVLCFRHVGHKVSVSLALQSAMRV